MTKIIRVESCMGCPYRQRADRFYGYICINRVHPKMLIETEMETIPEWCTLKDAPARRKKK